MKLEMIGDQREQKTCNASRSPLSTPAKVDDMKV
jgi:hypothetical protein